MVDASWPPVRLGVYARPFRRWLRRFPRSRLLLISGERLVADPAAEMARVQVSSKREDVEVMILKSNGKLNSS